MTLNSKKMTKIIVNIFLAAMSSSRSDVVTQCVSVGSSIRNPGVFSYPKDFQ